MTTHDNITAAAKQHADADEIAVSSLWRRNPPGREVVRVEHVWLYAGCAPPEEAVLSVRAHPTTGGRPLVAPVTWLREHYTEEPSA